MHDQDTGGEFSIPDDWLAELPLSPGDQAAIVDDLIETEGLGALTRQRIIREAARRGLPGPSASNSRTGRPLGAKTVAIRNALLDLTGEYDVMTVRQVFYQLVSRGVVPKTEKGGYRPVQAQVLKMRREGLLDWGFIADGTRWMRKPSTWDSMEDVLRATQRAYRRNLWQAQRTRPEVWLEKDALAGVVSDVTGRWDVPLMVSRGTSSATFLHSAAMEAGQAWAVRGIVTHVFALYDFDAAGRRAARSVEKGLREFTDAPIVFELLALTEEQIEAWDLPTRPAKASDPEAYKFGADAVELDAIPPGDLLDLVSGAIETLVDEEAWRQQQIVEREERETLARIVRGDSATG
jgi:hypothetical protein